MVHTGEISTTTTGSCSTSAATSTPWACRGRPRGCFRRPKIGSPATRTFNTAGCGPHWPETKVYSRRTSWSATGPPAGLGHLLHDLTMDNRPAVQWFSTRSHVHGGEHPLLLPDHAILKPTDAPDLDLDHVPLAQKDRRGTGEPHPLGGSSHNHRARQQGHVL